MTTPCPNGMLGKLESIEQHYSELEQRLNDSAVIANTREYAQLAKEHAQLGEVAGVIREYRKLLDEIGEHREVLDGDDAELRELAKGNCRFFSVAKRGSKSV